MPQMMPMLWVMMISLTMSTYLLMIILIYFLNLPNPAPAISQKFSKLTYWNWLW
uniref:ATP synthase F0 subunit 8 n=1 Tax=Pheidole smythiesii TaxID=297326 RepID=UPI00257C2855|nr:ATP synthase F0 subunit 8 [Pheidole smythiesii]WGV34069.1 ATP synthase F0 subunit 8 [Pheidole smythiesii]